MSRRSIRKIGKKSCVYSGKRKLKCFKLKSKAKAWIRKHSKSGAIVKHKRKARRAKRKARKSYSLRAKMARARGYYAQGHKRMYAAIRAGNPVPLGPGF